MPNETKYSRSQRAQSASRSRRHDKNSSPETDIYTETETAKIEDSPDEQVEATAQEPASHEDQAVESEATRRPPRTASNSSRGRRQFSHDKQKEEKKAGKAVPYPILLLVSFIASASFYSFPLWSILASSGQSQNLYSGLAMQLGLTPYNDFYGHGGSLFYLINQIGNTLGTTLLLYIFSLAALFFSALLIHNLLFRQTQSEKLSLTVASFSIFIIAGIAHGGDTASLFALPFALWIARFVDQYIHHDGRDEKFILFGIFTAIILTISPIFLLFPALSIIAIFIYNISQRRFGRGFYQLLAGIFGFIVIGYLTAYYALNAQTLYTSIEQSIIMPLSQFSLSSLSINNLWHSVLALIISGFIFAFYQGFRNLHKSGPAMTWHILMLLGSILTFLLILFSKAYDFTNILALLPFLILFIGESLAKGRQDVFGYLSKYLYTPLIMLVFALALPAVYHFVNKSVNSQEKTLASYVSANTTDRDRVYVLAPDKNINLLASRVASVDNVPSHYPVKFQQAYDLAVADMKDKYVILEAGQKVPDSLSMALKVNYKPVNVSGIKDFSVYQHN
ncbi:glycosyltransferase [Lactococcus termiticola]|uniref:Glycosyltransferase n=1 Tax=Lactococcus termiticola TaxID=2169526 RepID=A0A2R5HK44_9LACT|nr:glycosyltransferase [Lactococcus termiticola]GBG96831.1 glycosyltransferase [Lactococcus termiticola]